MTVPQTIILTILAAALVLFVWERWRYDLIALFALVAGVLTGVVPADKAFSGFSDPVVTTVAAVLVISAALQASGAVDIVADWLQPVLRHHSVQVGVLCAVVTVLSAFMNNVGALAVVMPAAMQVAHQSRRPPSELLMPLAFASLLGGLITLIGTPPNLLISAIRRDLGGETFSMFDFAPVGVGLAALGLAYLAVAWRLLPHRRKGGNLAEGMFRIEDYVAEARIPAGSPYIGRTVDDIERLAKGDASVNAIIREQFRRYVPSGHWILFEDDVLVLEAETKVLEKLVADAKLQLVGNKAIPGTAPAAGALGVTEAVVAPGSLMVGCSPTDLHLRDRYRVNLLAVGRRGRRTSARIKRLKFQVGDVVVLQGDVQDLPDILAQLGCLPLAQRRLKLGRPRRALLTILLLTGAVTLTTLEVLPVAIAFLIAVVLIVLTGVLTLDEVYEAVHWPILVLLGAMIPVSEALTSTGAADVLGSALAEHSGGLPPFAAVAVVLLATMAVTPVLNNAAAVLTMAPIAATFASQLGLNVDPFLMAVAVGSSCDFLTPIGHQSNTLVMGPGGYRFSDYWKLGLPLTVMVAVAGVPLIMAVWPVR